MPELKRNQRYFIEGQGEADKGTYELLDSYRDGFMSGAEKKPDVMEKTEGEREFINWIIDKVGLVAEMYGVDPHKYNSEHFHVTLDEIMDKHREEVGENVRMFVGLGGVISGEKDFRSTDSLNTAISVAHEFFHLFGLNKINFTEVDDKRHIGKIQRSGVRITHGLKDVSLRHIRFNGLNEGMTQELSRLFYGRVIRKSEKFKDEVEEFDRKNFVENPDRWLFPENATKCYGWLVSLFLDLCKAIQKKMPEKFKDFDDVTEEFFKVYFNGEIKDLKSLLDVIGLGSFGDLSEIGASSSLDDLKKIIKFRKKYNLVDDPALEKWIEEIKEEKK